MQLIYILFLSYRKINIFKPITSRLSNSEKYIVCDGFIGCNKDLIDNMSKRYDGEIILDIPDTFIKDILNYNDKFVETQIKTIRKIISNIEVVTDIKPTSEQIKNAREWCLKYNLPINENCIYKA